MRPDTQVFRPRFQRLCRDVIAPAIWSHPTTLDVSEWSSPERFAHEQARRAADAGHFAPITLPHAWGPVWGTTWFRLCGQLPDEPVQAAAPEGRRLRVRFDTGTEATVWDAAGNPVRGLDENRDAFELSCASHDGRRIDVLVEAACNHPFGDQVFEWDSRERAERWRSETPGLVTRAEVAVFDETVWKLHTRLLFAADLLAELDPVSIRAQDLYACLAHAVDTLDDTDVAASAPGLLAQIDDALRRAPGGSTPDLVCVAHAHIDTAWLWPIAETRRKTVRSWTNTLELLERTPGMRFVCSQPQQYAWLEKDAPGVFERIGRAVEAGGFEPIGSMWIEPDALVPSGESLIRQTLLGTRYLEDRFPNAPKQRIVFLPDTFGFPACLPTVMCACGLDTFITNKIHWNQTNTFPHTSFRWRGLDGSHVLAHNTPGGDYNATLTPKELRKAHERIVGRDAGMLRGAPVALQPYGYGDGGGGPTAEMLERIDASRACEGMPRTRHASVHDFVDALHHEDRQGQGLPEWSGPIDLELHRGTLTTHQWLKRANARAERGLRAAEFVDAARESDELRTKAIREAWQKTLLNQFHDILPGSSIAPVYEDARRDAAEVADTIGSTLATDPDAAPVLLSTASCERSAVVEIDGELRAVRMEPFSCATPTPIDTDPVRVEGGVVSNSLVSFEIDGCGRIASLRATDGPDLAADRPLNELRLYRDRPMNWDAWDIEQDYERCLVWTNDRPCEVEAVTVSPMRAEVRVRLEVGSSPYVMTYRLDAGSPIVEVLCNIDWQESHRLLRTESSPPIRASHATVGTQFGHVPRPTHRNTSWDRAAFEFACHGWMDLSEPGRGLAVLADGIYGRSVHQSTMGLSLLRAPTHPDPGADRGPNTLRYAFQPHAGDWRSAGVDHHAECLCDPVRVVRGVPTGSPFTVEASRGSRLEVAAFKRAEDNPDARVLRLVETRGMHTHARVSFQGRFSTVRRTDALERTLEHDESIQSAAIELDIRPFEIVTLLADR